MQINEDHSQKTNDIKPTLTLSRTTSLMEGRPSGLCILAVINWQRRRNSLSYRFFSSGSIGFHCSERHARTENAV